MRNYKDQNECKCKPTLLVSCKLNEKLLNPLNHFNIIVLTKIFLWVAICCCVMVMYMHKSDHYDIDLLAFWQGLEYVNGIFCRRVTPLHKKGYSKYDTKLHPVVRIQFRSSVKYGISSLLTLLQSLFWFAVVVLVRKLFLGRIEIFEGYQYYIGIPDIITLQTNDFYSHKKMIVVELFVFRKVTWSFNCLLRIIIISYLKSYNCIQIIGVTWNYITRQKYY